jgi:uncharacterized protein (DUF983 family)
MSNELKPRWKSAFLCRCPSCGHSGIFRQVIKVRDHCPNCNIDLNQFETADGPAFFAITIVGILVGIGAGLVEIIYQPPIWVHFALWLPAVFIGSAIIIRITKTLMIAHQIDLQNRKPYDGR